MAEHTKGKLNRRYEESRIIRDDNDKEVAAVSKTPDARRLVACWNACDGISTELLEEETRLIDAQKKETPCKPT